jgi:integrase
MNDSVVERFIGTGVRESTAHKYVSDLSKIEDLLGKDVDKLQRADLDKLMMKLRQNMPKIYWKNNKIPEKYSSATIRAYLFALKSYYKAFDQKKKAEWITLPKQSAKKEKQIIRDPKAFITDISKFEPDGVADDFVLHRDRTMLIFAYFLNTRRSELPIVLLSDIGEDDKVVAIEDVKGVSGRSSIPVPSQLFWDHLRVYLDSHGDRSEYLFPTINGGKMSVSSVNVAFRRFIPIMKKHGITHGFGSHTLRRSRLTRIAARTSTRQGMHISRHSSLTAYQKYIDAATTQEELDEMQQNGSLEV